MGEWPAKGDLNKAISREDVWSALEDWPCDGMVKWAEFLSNWVVPQEHIDAFVPVRAIFRAKAFFFPEDGKSINPTSTQKERTLNLMNEQTIPYKIYLEEDEMPKYWYNLRADMKNKPAPLLNPATLKPMTFEDLQPVFCDELIEQELDDTTPYIEIPKEIRDFYKMYRPAPLVRAYNLERKLGTPAKIYYKFEGNNTSGSHKLNSAIAQAYYAKKQGLKGVTTETGAGQWGPALSRACA